MADYTIGDIYQGGTSSFNPNYGSVFTGYRVAASELGMTTDPRTANQLQALNQSLNQGAIPIEVGVLKPETFDQIPKQHFAEMRRVAKLSGAKISLHAPLIEPSGMGEQGWSEAGRALAEKQLIDVIEKSVDLDDSGNMPITIHSSNIPGSEYVKTPEGKKIAKLVVVDRETGKPAQVLEEERLFYPSEMRKLTPEAKSKLDSGIIDSSKLTEKDFMNLPLDKGKPYSPEERLEILNHSKWNNDVSALVFNKERADEIINRNFPKAQKVIEEINQGKLKPQNLNLNQRQALMNLQNAQTYLEDTRQNIEGLFNKAYKFGSEADRQKLGQISEDFKKHLSEDPSLPGQSRALQNLLLNLKENVAPKMFVPIEEFAITKSSETLANVAFAAYSKFKDKAPIISVENLYPGMAFSMKKEGEKGLPGMNELIIDSKKKFVDRAISKGISEEEAKKQADRLIGMTLDVGHLNISRKAGFETKDIQKEVEAIAKHVKHVHLTDNFGYSDSHLPPGMGNVPVKEILQELEKEGFKGRKILEVGGWFEHFKNSPYQLSLEAMGSPIYGMDMSPYWNQSIGLQQGYSSGYGMMLPQTNYEMMGAGFSQLPYELGGQKGGGRSRMSGTPLE